jgi:hypothetical protein
MMAACARAPSPIPVGTNSGYYGNINLGSKFGVVIGEPASRQRQVLTGAGFLFAGNSGCDQNLRELVRCQPTDVFDVYESNRFASNGLIFVRIEGGKVVAIAWSLHVLPNGAL